MKKPRGAGLVYQPIYLDKRTGERKKASTWWIQYSVKGTRFRESSNSHIRQEAEQLLRSRLEAAARGEPAGPTTFERLAETLLDHYRTARRRSISRTQDAIAHLRRFFSNVKAHQIDSDLIESYALRRRGEQAAPATINRELAALRRAFGLAQSKGIVTFPPKISMLPEQSRPRGCIEDREYRAILDELPEYLKPVIQTAFVTGWRINSEILTLQKRDLDLDSGCLRLRSAGAGREFRLTPELRGVLAQQLEEIKQFELLEDRQVARLFHRNGQPIRDFRKAWAVACRRAGVSGRVPDDFRRTAVRNLEVAGVPRSIAMAMVGHRTDSIYRGIASVDEAELARSVLKIATFH